MKKLLFMSVVVLTSAGFYSCSESKPVPEPKPPVTFKVTSIVINYVGDLTIVAGVSITLSPIVFPVNATDKTINWTSSNTDVATINASGVVTSVNAGTTTITAAATDGSGITATETITVSVAPTGFPKISTHPAHVSTTSGESANFSVVADGSPAPTYQWQVLAVARSGASEPWWSDLEDVTGSVSGTTTAMLTQLDLTTLYNDYQYRCVVSNTVGSVTSQAVQLTVTGPPVIYSQPKDFIASATSGSFAVGAVGNPAPTYQWQVSTNGGGSWSDLFDNNLYIYGATLAGIRITIPPPGVGWANPNNNQYRCIVRNMYGNVVSNAATLIVRQ